MIGLSIKIARSLVTIDELKDQLELNQTASAENQQQFNNLKAEFSLQNQQNLILNTKLQSIEEQRDALNTEVKKYYNLYEQEKEAKYIAKSQTELALLEVKNINEKLTNYQEAKEQIMQHAKAAMFEAGSQLSNNLIDEHKRETNQAKADSQQQIKAAQNQLNDQFQVISNVIANLNMQVTESKNTTELVKQALLTPNGAGALAEITLENILKASNLIQGCDFIMQYSVIDLFENIRLRPDAVVFLAAGNVMIIDSKASKFFTELADGEDKLIISKLKASMRTHIKELASKDYKEAIRAHLNKHFATKGIRHITTIMFLPTDVALQKLQAYDNEFMQKAWELEIFPAGPAGVINILTHAKFLISEDRQTQNYQVINEEVRKLMHNMATLYEYIKKLGSGIQAAASNYDRLAGSFNSNVLLRLRNLQKFGLTTANNKTINSPLERYQITLSGNSLIDADSIAPLSLEADNENIT